MLNQLPCGHPNKTQHSDEGISDSGLLFLMLLFISEKNQNLLDIQEQYVCKLEKLQSDLELLTGVSY